MSFKLPVSVLVVIYAEDTKLVLMLPNPSGCSPGFGNSMRSPRYFPDR